VRINFVEVRVRSTRGVILGLIFALSGYSSQNITEQLSTIIVSCYGIMGYGVGEVYRINLKAETAGERGIPKRPVDSAWVSRKGVVGDFNRYRHEEKHDDTDMAILIFALETIQQLNAEGWPIKPGDLGENFTTRGIPYETFAVDKRYRIGESIVQISKVCHPCSYLYLLPYVGKEKANFIKVMYRRRGWYARVEKEGKVERANKIEELQAQDA